jgi:hypothetical protein
MDGRFQERRSTYYRRDKAPSSIRVNRLPRDIGKPDFSDFGPFGQRQSIIHIYPEIFDGIFDIGMAEQDLHGAKIACGFVNQRCLGPSH